MTYGFFDNGVIVNHHTNMQEAFNRDYLRYLLNDEITDAEDAYWTDMEALERGADEFEYYHGMKN